MRMCRRVQAEERDKAVAKVTVPIYFVGAKLCNMLRQLNVAVATLHSAMDL